MIIADPTNNLTEAKAHMYPKMMPDLIARRNQAIITPEPQALPQPQPNPEMQDLATQDINALDQANMAHRSN